MREFVATVTRKGQVTIPSAVRKHLGIGTPDKIAIVVADDGQVAIRPATLTVRNLRGILPSLPGQDAGDFENLIAEAMEDLADREVSKLRSE